MMDVVPAVTKLCGAEAPKKPVDGLDVWPLFSGAATKLDREPLLYFDATHLQCARWQQWKLHVSRYTHRGYSPAPADSTRNLLLPKPELYDLEKDPDESFDVADMHPEIVSQMLEKIETGMKTFPDAILRDWEETKLRKVSPTAAGALPRSID